MPMLGSYNPYGDLGSGSYNPFDDRSSWYGVPNYGASYNRYIQTQQQPLSLAQIVGMVRQVQEGMNRSPVARMMSPVQQSEIPSRIAENIMTDQNRLLSMPRRKMERSGSNALQESGIEQDMNAPAGTAPSKSGSGGSGSGLPDYRGGGGHSVGTSNNKVVVRQPRDMIGRSSTPSGVSGRNLGPGYVGPKTPQPPKLTGAGTPSYTGIGSQSYRANKRSGRTTGTGRTAAGLRW